MISKKQKDLLKVAKREKTFATLAKKEGQGAAKRAKQESKKGLKESAKDSRREEKWDNDFSKRRERIAAHAKIKAYGQKNKKSS